MKKNILSATLTVILALTALTTTRQVQASRGGAFAGGLFTGAVIGTALSRDSYRSDRDYYGALENENARLREENADLRAELRIERRSAKR
jgi:hypothetical protein